MARALVATALAQALVTLIALIARLGLPWSGPATAFAMQPRRVMNIETTHLFAAIVVGLGATVVVDLWAMFLKRVLSIPSLSYCLVGRWILYMPKGTFAHASISTAPPQRAECMVGWIAYYVIGAAFALTDTQSTAG